jgi:hypothetical protein
MMAAIRHRANPPPPKKTKRRTPAKPRHSHADIIVGSYKGASPEAFTISTLPKPLHCSFCGNSKAAYIVAGPKVFICANCVETCREAGSRLIATNALFSQAAASLEDNEIAPSSAANANMFTEGLSPRTKMNPSKQEWINGDLKPPT